jgi:hypothetical protein
VTDLAGFEWDETLYAGSAAFYARGRMPYPAAVAGAVRDQLGLDGTGRLLDVGCGPGSLTLLLAPLFEAAVGVDADRDMIAEAGRAAARAAIGNVSWRCLRAEELPTDPADPTNPTGLGTFRVVTFSQSFHWMDQPRVARQVRAMLASDGAWVHVGATTHRGVDGDDPLPHPRPPWDAANDLVTSYLGPVRRAGRSTLPTGETAGGEEDVMRAAGYAGPTRIDVGGGEVVTRTADDLVAAVFSLSSSTPHLFGDRLAAFERDLRGLLSATSPAGVFAERRRETALVIWYPG